MPVNNSCDRTQTLHGWEITLVKPINNKPSNIFQYKVVRKTRFPKSRQISNILICLCPDITDAERKALLNSCSCLVYYADRSCKKLCDCFIQNTIAPYAANPARCKGLKFNNIPSKGGGAEQTRIVLTFTLTEALPVGPVKIGFKAGRSETCDVWKNICGPVCEPIPVLPTRGIML